MTLQSRESGFSLESHSQLVAALSGAGYLQVSVRHDGCRLILEGDVGSFEGKIEAARLLRPLTESPILNCIRVHPSD